MELIKFKLMEEAPKIYEKDPKKVFDSSSVHIEGPPLSIMFQSTLFLQYPCSREENKHVLLGWKKHMSQLLTIDKNISLHSWQALKEYAEKRSMFNHCGGHVVSIFSINASNMSMD